MALTKIINDLGFGLEAQSVEGKYCLVGSVSFELKNTLQTNYSADYHYNGSGALQDKKSWDLKEIEADENGSTRLIDLEEMNSILRPHRIQLYDIFHQNLLARLQLDYPNQDSK